MGLPMRWADCAPIEPIQEQKPRLEPRRRVSRSLRRLRFLGAAIVCGMVGITAGIASSAVQKTFRPISTLQIEPAIGTTFVLSSPQVDRAAGFVTVIGSFENRKTLPLKQVEAVVELLDKENNTLGLESALVAAETVPARGNSAFQVVIPDKPQAAFCRVHFRELLGATLN